MVLAYEILREAGVRLPRPVGSAISIVGALIMGDAAVSAGIVGAPMVITIAITSVAGFVVPDQTESAAFLRLISMFAAAFLGGFGIAIAFLGMLIHLAGLKSFGVPYFTAITLSRDQQDIFVRMPLWMMRERPADISEGDVTRRRTGPPPPKGDAAGGTPNE
jgi:spore germination protein KA